MCSEATEDRDEFDAFRAIFQIWEMNRSQVYIETTEDDEEYKERHEPELLEHLFLVWG